MEREKRILIKEAKEEIWKKWRQKKGRNGTNPKLIIRNDRQSLEEKLRRVESEVEKYKKVVENRRKEEEIQLKMKNKGKDETEERTRRLQRKKRMEEYWEKLRWVTRLLDETNIAETDLNKMRKEDKEGEECKKTWEEKTEQQKMELLWEEEMEGKKVSHAETAGRDEKIQEAMRLKRSWKGNSCRRRGRDN